VIWANQKPEKIITKTKRQCGRKKNKVDAGEKRGCVKPPGKSKDFSIFQTKKEDKSNKCHIKQPVTFGRVLTEKKIKNESTQTRSKNACYIMD
jgi:hypothetical protein